MTNARIGNITLAVQIAVIVIHWIIIPFAIMQWPPTLDTWAGGVVPNPQVDMIPGEFARYALFWFGIVSSGASLCALFLRCISLPIAKEDVSLRVNLALVSTFIGVYAFPYWSIGMHHVYYRRVPWIHMNYDPVSWMGEYWAGCVLATFLPVLICIGISFAIELALDLNGTRRKQWLTFGMDLASLTLFGTVYLLMPGFLEWVSD